MSTLAKWVAPELTNGSTWMPSFSSMVENFFGRDFDSMLDTAWKGTVIPAVNISQTKDAYNVEVAAPGMKREDFKVEVENDVMTISAERKEEKEEKSKKYTRREYSYNAFSRSFVLPEGVKSDDVKATYKDGVLSIALPKTEVEKKKATTKQIAIS
jgi:HSP20 family protein